MNSDSPTLPVKILAAAVGFALMVAVPLLTVHYAARAHAEIAAPAALVAACANDCAVRKNDCAQHGNHGCGAGCPTTPCDRPIVH